MGMNGFQAYQNGMESVGPDGTVHLLTVGDLRSMLNRCPLADDAILVACSDEECNRLGRVFRVTYDIGLKHQNGDDHGYEHVPDSLRGHQWLVFEPAL